MKATHKLVSIEELEKVINEVKHLGSMTTVTNMNLVLDNSPEVDLSEEGIEGQATALYGKSIYSMDEVDAYKKCAENLLAVPRPAKSSVKNPWS